MPLPGIKVGEIGAKLGMNGTNNGFLGFEHVRIPRDHLLMKNSQVLEVSIVVFLNRIHFGRGIDEFLTI